MIHPYIVKSENVTSEEGKKIYTTELILLDMIFFPISLIEMYLFEPSKVINSDS